jgi:SET domain-containing protein
MLLVDTIVKPSDTHGLGCFANEPIEKGRAIWVYDRRMDLVIKESEVSKLPKPAQAFLYKYAYVTKSWRTRSLVLRGDNSRYMNHSDDPNTANNRACRDINSGEELTCDYASSDLDAGAILHGECSTVGHVDRLPKMLAPLASLWATLFRRRELPQAPPRHNINETFVSIPLDQQQYNKTDEFSFVLRPSGIKGVGVFATHGIVKGTYLALFPPEKPRFFSKRQMEKDPRLKRFCEFYGVETETGSSVASNFSRMSVGWYLNHSETPNAHHEDYRYFASRDIAADEEVTIDYRRL